MYISLMDCAWMKSCMTIILRLCNSSLYAVSTGSHSATSKSSYLIETLAVEREEQTQVAHTTAWQLLPAFLWMSPFSLAIGASPSSTRYGAIYCTLHTHTYTHMHLPTNPPPPTHSKLLLQYYSDPNLGGIEDTIDYCPTQYVSSCPAPTSAHCLLQT